MDQWRRVVIVGLLVVVLLLSREVEQSQGAVTCGTVTQDIAPCVTYAKAGATPPPRNSPCCSGVRALDSLASVSVQNRRDICKCLQSAAQAFKPDPAAVAAIPGACGVSRSINPSQNCNTLP